MQSFDSVFLGISSGASRDSARCRRLRFIVTGFSTTVYFICLAMRPRQGTLRRLWKVAFCEITDLANAESSVKLVSGHARVSIRDVSATSTEYTFASCFVCEPVRVQS